MKRPRVGTHSSSNVRTATVSTSTSSATANRIARTARTKWAANWTSSRSSSALPTTCVWTSHKNATAGGTALTARTRKAVIRPSVSRVATASRTTASDVATAWTTARMVLMRPTATVTSTIRDTCARVESVSTRWDDATSPMTASMLPMKRNVEVSY